MSGGADSPKTVLYALGANLGIAVAKSVAAVVTNSGALMAEAIHQGLLLGHEGVEGHAGRGVMSGRSPMVPSRAKRGIEDVSGSLRPGQPPLPRLLSPSGRGE